jgi:phosphoribosyl 1,2-cyclic phosphodiesterase
LARSDLTIRFWGVRGSIACPGPETARYGGNTSCVEVRCGERLLIFDAGTGLRALGHALAKTGRPAVLDLLFSHTHFDHVVGLPFFAPCYDKQSQMRFWAGHLKRGSGIESVLGKSMAPPLFPIPLDIFAAQIDFIDFAAGGSPLVPHPGISLRTAPLNHPNGATGYRVEYRGKSVAYITDTEHFAGRRDPNVMRLIQNVDIMIYDSTYTDDEYLSHRSWGHSTWQEGVRLANAAQAGKLVIFHHDPDHDDDFMDKIAAEAEAVRPGTVVAREGLVLTL